MKLKSIQFDDASNPSALLVEMTTDEAAYLARVTGKQSGTNANAVMAGGSQLNSEIQGCLFGELFARFYEDGYDEYIANRGAPV